MTNKKTNLQGIKVEDLLLQIQEAQNRIQEAQKQISETLEAIQALQAQEPEQQETQQVEEPKQLSQGEYYQKWLDAVDKGWGDAGDEMRQTARRLEELEDKVTHLGDVYCEFDGYHTAKHLRSLSGEMDQLDSGVMDCIDKEKFEEVEKKIRFVESGEFLNDFLCFPENMDKAKKLVAQYEAAIKDGENRYGDSSKIGRGSYVFR